MTTRSTVLSVLVPAWNEQGTLGALLESVLSVDLSDLGVEIEVVVCDDGSTDGTAQVVREAQRLCPRLRFVQHEKNRGKGAAVRTGLAAARGDLTLIQDADLEYGVGEYKSLVRRALAGAPVVYGSRFLAGHYPTSMHLLNYLGNRLLTALANGLFKLNITDEATCLKLFRTSVLRSLDLRCEGFDFCPEVNAKLGLLNIPIVEVPVQYKARNKAEGKKVSWHHAVEAVLVLGKYYFRGLLAAREPVLPLPTTVNVRHTEAVDSRQ